MICLAVVLYAGGRADVFCEQRACVSHQSGRTEGVRSHQRRRQHEQPSLSSCSPCTKAGV